MTGPGPLRALDKRLSDQARGYVKILDILEKVMDRIERIEATIGGGAVKKSAGVQEATTERTEDGRRNHKGDLLEAHTIDITDRVRRAAEAAGVDPEKAVAEALLLSDPNERRN